MIRIANMLICVAAMTGLATLGYIVTAHADDGSKGANCKKGWHMCWCKREGHPRRQCETDYIYKMCDVCWGDIAQYQCLKGKKNEVLDVVFAEAKKTDKLVLYIGNTGG